MPVGPALPKGVRTPSTKTTSRSDRGRRSSDVTGPPHTGTPHPGRRGSRTSYPSVTKVATPARSVPEVHSATEQAGAAEAHATAGHRLDADGVGRERGDDDAAVGRQFGEEPAALVVE